MKVLTRLRRTTLSCLFVTSFVLLISLFNGNENKNSLSLSRVVQDSEHQQVSFQESDASVLSRKVPVFFGRKTEFPVRQSSRRQVNVDFEKLSQKGALSLCDMKKSNGLYPNLASQFTNFNQITAYGWSILGDYAPEFKDALNDAFESSSFQVSDGDNKPIHITHDKDSTVNGKTYKKTQAYFMNVFNSQAGFIVADSNLSPQGANKKFGLGISKNDLVPLQQWSDLVFLLWKDQAGSAIKNLKGIFRATITNDVTQVIMDELFPDLDGLPESWATRRVFEMDSYEAKILLGSPNGQGIAFFLIQHKAQLGEKKVESVSVWWEDGYQIYFEIVDVPAGELDQ